MAAAASPRWTPRIAIAPRASPAATASLAPGAGEPRRADRGAATSPPRHGPERPTPPSRGPERDAGIVPGGGVAGGALVLAFAALLTPYLLSRPGRSLVVRGRVDLRPASMGAIPLERPG